MQYTRSSTDVIRESTLDWYPGIELLHGQVSCTSGLRSTTNRLVAPSDVSEFSEISPHPIGPASMTKPSVSTIPVSQPPYAFTLELQADFLTLPEQEQATGIPILLKVDADGHTRRRSAQPLWASSHDNYTHQTGVSFTVASPSATWNSFPRLPPTGPIPQPFSGHACNSTPSIALLQTCILFAALCFYCRT